MALGKQIHYYRTKLGWTLQDLGSRVGLGAGTISALELRDSKTSKKTLEMASAFGLTVEQLLDEGRDWLDEKGRPRVDQAPVKPVGEVKKADAWPLPAVSEDVLRSLKKEDRARAEGALLAVLSQLGVTASSAGPSQIDDGPASNDAEYAYINRIDAKLSAGRGTIIYDAEQRGRLSFRRDWLRSQGVNNPDRAVLAEVDGDSMAGHIPHGATILIDLSQTETVNGKVYAIFHDKEFYVKRLWSKAGITTAHSDNEDKETYPPFPLVKDGDQVIGRVFWCGFGL
ncbi:helix-turn-helix transcriptional regulator [Achromobacter sp. GG226]|uniref:XRE family transcriptional regulator n=1 Tax=Verticiella alkaliphila TaxID=2779529 RepID=UPI001C0CBF1D|nr:XRE family transcriptional regulator [Verticiella sp. GG226]MBU4609172.1 helix-turn-helix transcriptional regulator [Verticiella sp. GG226]